MEKVADRLLVKSKKFPKTPGVYWFSKKRKRIYIGKAASLKTRIAGYFRTSDPRIKEMVGEADNLSFLKTSNVLEAVILEANLIKKYSPKYNVKEKDNRSFVYLVISKEKFPRIFIARGREIEKYGGKNRIFGPYQSYRILKTALQLARKIFPYGTCRANQGKSCFDYQIGLCPGICIGAVSEKDYRENIRNLALFFQGERKRLIKKLKKENPAKLIALKYVEDVALIQRSRVETFKSQSGAGGRIEGYDISHFGGSEPVGAMSVFINGQADKSQYRLFKIKDLGNNRDDLAMLREVLIRRFRHDEWPRSDIVLVDGGRNQISVAKKVLAELSIFIPIVGIAKVLGHSGRASVGDKLVFENAKPRMKKLLTTSRQIFQQVRNEAHRFAISFQRRRRRLK